MTTPEANSRLLPRLRRSRFRGQLPNRLDEEPECGRTLGSAGIVEKEAGNRRGVRLEYAPQTSRAELLFDERLHHIR